MTGHVASIKRLESSSTDAWTRLETPGGTLRIRSDRALDAFLALMGGDPHGLPADVAAVLATADLPTHPPDVGALLVETVCEELTDQAEIGE